MNNKLHVWNKVKIKYISTTQKIRANAEIFSVIEIETETWWKYFNYWVFINNTDIKLFIHPESIIEILSNKCSPITVPKIKANVYKIGDKVTKDWKEAVISWTYKQIEIPKGQRYFDESLYQINWSWFFYPANNFNNDK